MSESKIDQVKHCTYTPGGKSPHIHKKLTPRPDICDTILDNIGNTPLVRINKLTKSAGVECELLAKCEFFNSGGSVKDRIGLRMVEDAEKAGRIKPGDTLIEPTSGNTGIGLALAAAIKGYRMIITLPEKMSKEKVDVLKALGAEIIRTPTEAASDSPESHIGVALRLNKEIPNSHILDQYVNPSNPLAHYDGTAEELLQQCGGKIDALVCGAGTGGTIAGIAKKLKEKLPNIKVFGVDPHGSILAQPASLNDQNVSYQVEGIGYDFIPKVLDRTVVDEWVKSEDKSSFLMARRMIAEEGLLCGGSSGTAMVAALEICKRFKKGDRVVVVLPDSVRNYMTKFLDLSWMVEYGFMDASAVRTPQEEWLSKHTVSELSISKPITVDPDVSVEACIGIMKTHGFDQIPVVSSDGAILGMVTLATLSSKLLSGRVNKKDHISEVSFKNFRQVSSDTPLDVLSVYFQKDHFALVTTSQTSIDKNGNSSERVLVSGILTPIDIVNFALQREQ